MRIIESKPDQVLLDAARLLGQAQRIVKLLATSSALTPEYRARKLSEARAAIDAATARL